MNKIITDVYIGKESNFIKYKAIWDTGSSETTISEKVVKQLNLNKHGYVILSTINGERKSDKYLCLLSLIGHSKSISINPACFGNRNDFDIIIGMDIISYGKFLLENDNFSFIIKSLL